MADRIVQLHFGRHVHPIYREQLHAVPEGWRYRSEHPALSDATAPTKRVVESAARYAAAQAVAERAAIFGLSELGYVHRVRAPQASGATLIHSGERLIVNAPVPYVVDFEQAELFVLYQAVALRRPWARMLLERSLCDDRLRFLLAWSAAARRSMLAVLRPDAKAVVEPKLRVVPPAIRPAADRPRRRRDGPLRVLFVGTVFYEKGGIEAVEALREVRRTHDVTLDLLSYVPPEWQARLVDEPGLTLHAPGGADLVQHLYREADALLFPSHMDTFGYVVLEAMAHGLPVLAPRHLALTETVQDDASGLLFPPENMLYGDDALIRFRHVLPPPKRYLTALRHPTARYVGGIASVLARLAEEPGLYDRLAEGALSSVRSGAHATERRRSLLSEIYEAAAR